MSRSARHEVSGAIALRLAWARIWERSSGRSRCSCGIDNETLIDFNQNPIAGLREIAHHLRRGGGYQFQRLRAHLVPKSDTKDRVICIPTIRDRIVQRAVVDFLARGDRCGLANEISYGFIPNRSVEKAAERARAIRRLHPFAYKTDITSFFDSISRSILHQRIRRHVRERSLHDLLFAASNCEIEPNTASHAKKIKAAGIREGKGVRQGMPLSPFFANLLLKQFDRTLQAAKISAIRYADDLICFASSEAECSTIHDHIQTALATEGLSIPAPGPGSKTQIYPPAEPADFLGLQLRPASGDYLLEVSSDQTAKIRQRIVELADIQTLGRIGISFGGFFRRLDGLLAGYAGAYAFAHNAGHLEVVLKSARADAVQRLFEVGLGIPLKGLSPEKRRFLGIEEVS